MSHIHTDPMSCVYALYIISTALSHIYKCIYTGTLAIGSYWNQKSTALSTSLQNSTPLDNSSSSTSTSTPPVCLPIALIVSIALTLLCTAYKCYFKVCMTTIFHNYIYYDITILRIIIYYSLSYIIS